ncbi:hypothetical protein ES708_26352 [subsurface metagenome]
MGQKSPAELDSKTIRIHIATYRILQSLSLRDNITMNEALTKLITGRLKPGTEPELTQIPVPVFFKLRPIESDGATFKPKFIPDNNDIGVKLKSIQ